MAREDVNIKVSANVAEAIRLWKAMEAGPEGMARELDSLGAKGKKAGSGMAGEFDKLVGKWVSIGAAITAAKQILDAFMASQQAALQRTSGATLSADQMSRELFLLTAGDKSLKAIQKDMLKLAAGRGAAPEKSRDVMAALLGAGYSYDTVVKGGGAEAVLKTLSATNATGKEIDAKQLTDAITGYLSASGQGKTPENLLKVGQSIQGLFAATKLEITDLQNLAPRAKNIADTAGLTDNAQIAMLSQFKDVTTADVGATAFHTAVMRLSLAKNNRRTQRALKELGLKPEDVDFQGESFFQVQDTLAGAFEKAGPQAPRIKGAIFGNEGVLAGNVLFSRAGAAQTQERIAMSADAAAFNRAAAVTEGGFAAKRNVAEAKSTLAHIEGGFVDPETARTVLLTHLKETGAGNLSRFGAEKAFDAALWWTQSAESALNFATPMASDAPKLIEQAKAESVNINITLTDQNSVAIPHKAEVHNLNKRGKSTTSGGF